MERKVKEQDGVVYWKRRRKRVKRNEGAWHATRKKNMFLGPDFHIYGIDTSRHSSFSVVISYP